MRKFAAAISSGRRWNVVNVAMSFASRWSGVAKNALCMVSLRVVFHTPSIDMNSGQYAGSRCSSIKWRFEVSHRLWAPAGSVRRRVQGELPPRRLRPTGVVCRMKTAGDVMRTSRGERR